MPQGSVTLSDVYAAAQRRRLELSSGIELLERCESGAGGPLAAPMFFTEAPRDPSGAGGSASAAGPAGAVAVDPALMDGLRVKLAELQRMCADMGQLWRNHANKTQRELWRRRVEVMGEEAEALRLALDRCAAKEHRRRREAQERAELLVARAGGQGGRILSEADAEIRDMETAKRAGRVLEDTLAQGIATLSHMAQQREVLKSAQRRALDMLNYVGLSDAVLKKINRRQLVDRAISYGGMLLTLIVIFIVWRWTR
ncbi:unnamed protein product [Closterium sp. NIES-65]|nr:unnamed protein product [Closterium sp. NIES-65]